MLPEWTLHKGARFEASWKSPAERTACQGVSHQSSAGSTLGTARHSGSSEEEPTTVPTGRGASPESAPLRGRSRSCAVLRSHLALVLSATLGKPEAAVSEWEGRRDLESVTMPPAPLQDSEPGQWELGRGRSFESDGRSKFQGKIGRGYREAKDETVFRADFPNY